MSNLGSSQIFCTISTPKWIVKSTMTTMNSTALARR
jgi:hypothetical protein